MKYSLFLISMLLLTACATDSHSLSESEQVLGYDKSSREYRKGIKEARANILQNKLELRAYGLIVEPPRELNEDPKIKEAQDALARKQGAIARKYSEILMQHNVTTVETGCVIDSMDRVMGYQETIVQEISARYGQDFFERAMDQAKAAVEGAP